MKEAEWQEVKSELVYDFESKEINFGNQKATNMKNNKRITLPKCGSVRVIPGSQEEGCCQAV